MNLETMMPWLGAIALILSLGNTVTGFLTTGAKENAKKIAQQEEGIDDLRRRVQHVEGELKHLPDKDAVHRLELSIKDIQSAVGELAQAAAATERTARRVEDFLISQRNT